MSNTHSQAIAADEKDSCHTQADKESSPARRSCPFVENVS